MEPELHLSLPYSELNLFFNLESAIGEKKQNPILKLAFMQKRNVQQVLTEYQDITDERDVLQRELKTKLEKTKLAMKYANCEAGLS